MDSITKPQSVLHTKLLEQHQQEPRPSIFARYVQARAMRHALAVEKRLLNPSKPQRMRRPFGVGWLTLRHPL